MPTGRLTPPALTLVILAVLAVTVFAIVVAFGQEGGLGGPQSVTTPTPAAKASPVPVTVTSSGDVTVTDAANGARIRIAQGHTVTVTLGSTYWMFNGSSDPAVLEPAGQATYTTGSCVPGGGCGTASLSFKAVGPGQADVTASRTSCGEALACGPDQSSFRIIVVVSA